MKVLILVFGLLPLLASATWVPKCKSWSGKPISTKPFRIFGNCHAFYQCSNGILSTQNCAPGTVFNPKLRVCDHPRNVPGCNVHSVVACEDKSKTISCPSGSVIVVKDGFYGRKDGTTCPSSYIKVTSGCSASGSLEKLKKTCNWKNSCKITPTNDVFGDPCVNTYKYVKLDYYCKAAKHPSNWHKQTICEYEKKTVSCPAGQVMWVKSAVYGRSDKTTCPSDKIKTTSCAAKGSLEKVRASCNGKNSCSVHASNSVFGDPCYNTFKYVKMVYYCHRSYGWKKVTVCEDNTKTISCGANQVIVLGNGFYGRTDGTTCPHKKIKTTKCAAVGSLTKLRKSCHGKNSCTINSSNKVFGDPCVGTYKYVRVSYKCRTKRAKCTDSKGNPISGHPFLKPGDCKHFYQCSNGVLHTRPCAPGTAFNPKIGVCDHPHNVPGCS